MSPPKTHVQALQRLSHTDLSCCPHVSSSSSPLVKFPIKTLIKWGKKLSAQFHFRHCSVKFRLLHFRFFLLLRVNTLLEFNSSLTDPHKFPIHYATSPTSGGGTAHRRQPSSSPASDPKLQWRRFPACRSRSHGAPDGLTPSIPAAVPTAILAISHRRHAAARALPPRDGAARGHAAERVRRLPQAYLHGGRRGTAGGGVRREPGTVVSVALLSGQ